MKRFVIERNLPGVQNLAPGEYQEAAAKSNAAIQRVIYSPEPNSWDMAEA